MHTLVPDSPLLATAALPMVSRVPQAPQAPLTPGHMIVNLRESMPGIPVLGLIGPDAIREAFDGDLDQLRDLLSGAVRAELALKGDEDWWPYMHGVFDDFIVVENKDGRLMRYPYAVDGTSVTLGEPVEVQKTFSPVAADAHTVMTEALTGAFLETTDNEGSAYQIRVIRAGLSGNNNYYPDAVLKEAVSLFEGARVFVKSDAEHLRGAGKDVRNLMGQLSEASFVEGSGPDTGEIQARLDILQPGGDVAVKLHEAWDRKMTGLFGFSIDAIGVVSVTSRNGKPVREAKKINKIRSVDLIVEPGAGGGVIDLIESIKENLVMDREQLIALLEAQGLLTGKNTDTMSDGDLQQVLTEGLASANTGNGPGAADGQTAGLQEAQQPDQTDLREAVRMVEARASMRTRVTTSSLPQQAKNKLTAEFELMESFTGTDVDSRIRAEADYLASMTESGSVSGMGDAIRIETGETRAEKTTAMFEAFFDPAHKDHRHARSFRECYVQATGDKRISGRESDCDQTLMREALDSTSFPDALGNTMNRRMVADYNLPGVYDVYRSLIGTPVPLNDFRTNERVRIGGYGDMPVVNEGADYTALNSPSDEKATYGPQKRGGTEDVTLEMIANDDVAAIRRIPVNMSRSAKRTQSKFVLDFVRTNPAIYDGVSLFHTSHKNLGAAALDATSLAAARLAMLQQTEQDTGDQLGIPAKCLLVPSALEETAVDLFRRKTENDKSFIQSLALDILPVWYWTDNKDWALVADAMDIPLIEFGYYGSEEPEMFIQDNPTVGSVFSSDKITYKLRHIYGGVPVDYRGFYKAVVA